METQVLVIVDMQKGFTAADDEDTIQSVLIAIQDAIDYGIPIFIVEYDTSSFKQTLDCIVDAVSDYDKVYFVSKMKNDGGQEIEETLKEHDLKGSELIFCGVETGHCLNETISTLVHKFQETITVIKEACYCSLCFTGEKITRDEVFKIKEIYSHPNVELV